MDLRTPLLVVSLLSCLGLGAWGMGLKGEVGALQEKVSELEARQEAAAQARAERRSERRSAGPRGAQGALGGRASGGRASGGGPGGMGLIEGSATRRRASDSGGDRSELLRVAEENVRAEMAAERKAHFAERAEEMDAALRDYMAQAGYAEEVSAEISALFDANRADISELFARVDAGELDRSAVREEMHLIREDTAEALVELLGEEEAESLEQAVFRGDRRPSGGRSSKE